MITIANAKATLEITEQRVLIAIGIKGVKAGDLTGDYNIKMIANGKTQVTTMTKAQLVAAVARSRADATCTVTGQLEGI